MKRLLILPLLLLPHLLTAETKLPQKEHFQLFLLAGQSNMSGRGKLDAESKKSVPRVLAMNPKLEWQLAIEPLHWDKKAAGVGLGRTFAEIIAAKHPEDSIGLIPAACGGSSITTWVPGGYHKQTDSHPYDDAIKRAKIAMKNGTLKAILWHQGESDSNPKSAALHEARLTALIERFRKDLDSPNLPFIIGQLGHFPGAEANEGKQTIDAAQMAVAKKMKNVTFVNSDGFNTVDGIHFDTASQRVFAERYAQAYFKIAE